MTPKGRFASAFQATQLEQVAKAVKELGVWPVLCFALVYIIWFTLRPMEQKIDAHALKSEMIGQHLQDEQTSHNTTNKLLQRMCVSLAKTNEQRDGCLK